MVVHTHDCDGLCPTDARITSEKPALGWLILCVNIPKIFYEVNLGAIFNLLFTRLFKITTRRNFGAMMILKHRVNDQCDCESFGARFNHSVLILIVSTKFVESGWRGAKNLPARLILKIDGL